MSRNVKTTNLRENRLEAETEVVIAVAGLRTEEEAETAMAAEIVTEEDMEEDLITLATEEKTLIEITETIGEDDYKTKIIN